MYTLYGMALGLGAEPNLAFLMTSVTPNVGSEISGSVSGSATSSIRSQTRSASSLLESE